MASLVTYKLLADIRSMFNGRVYAKDLERVAVIADHGCVLIVEKDGKRFPAPTEIVEGYEPPDKGPPAPAPSASTHVSIQTLF